jgi:SAM-dependent methyltransferase
VRANDFEQRYQRECDPWRYRSSEYESVKYDATLRACGPGPFESAIELGGSIGVFSALLAPRCAALTTIDFSPTAVRAARQELMHYRHAQVILGEIPEAIPADAYDLVVASEVLYYLAPAALAQTLSRLESAVAEGGRLVAVHWRPTGPERPLSAAAVHRALGLQPWLRVTEDSSTSAYLLHVLQRV